MNRKNPAHNNSVICKDYHEHKKYYIRYAIYHEHKKYYIRKDSNMNPISDNDSYMTVKEFCERLQISTSTAYRMIKTQQIPAIRFGRRYKIPRSIFDQLNQRYL